MDRDYSPTKGSSITTEWDRGGITLEHVDEHPVHFRSKKEMKTYLKSKGLSSGALL